MQFKIRRHRRSNTTKASFFKRNGNQKTGKTRKQTQSLQAFRRDQLVNGTVAPTAGSQQIQTDKRPGRSTAKAPGH